MSNSDLLTIFDFFSKNIWPTYFFFFKVTHIPNLHLHCTLGETTQGRHTGSEMCPLELTTSLATITFSMTHMLTGQYPDANASIRFISDLFPHMNEAWNQSENVGIRVLYSCYISYVLDTILADILLIFDLPMQLVPNKFHAETREIHRWCFNKSVKQTIQCHTPLLFKEKKKKKNDVIIYFPSCHCSFMTFSFCRTHTHTHTHTHIYIYIYIYIYISQNLYISTSSCVLNSSIKW